MDTKDIICILLSLLGLAYICDADCIWYGQCGYNTGIAKDKKLNCKYSGPPKPFSTQLGVEKFKENCPNLYTGPNVTTCCSDDQMFDAERSGGISTPGLTAMPQLLSQLHEPLVLFNLRSKAG
ncbi:NPC intracellular cholesterol transporter 1 [Bulinus truncatus]|nr:NPC intracellular cholesterol transporter 1 [Bulinus truncatus]